MTMSSYATIWYDKGWDGTDCSGTVGACYGSFWTIGPYPGSTSCENYPPDNGTILSHRVIICGTCTITGFDEWSQPIFADPNCPYTTCNYSGCW